MYLPKPLIASLLKKLHLKFMQNDGRGVEKTQNRIPEEGGKSNDSISSDNKTWRSHGVDRGIIREVRRKRSGSFDQRWKQ